MQPAGLGTDAQAGTNPGALNPVGSANSLGYTVGQGMSTGESGSLGDGASNHFNQMAFSIEKVTVTAKSRALKLEYSLELAQDLKAIHGLNAEQELANILSTEILAEINREVIRTIYKVASRVQLQTLQPQVLSTSTLTPTVVGLLRSSRVFCSKSSAMPTQSHKELVEERATPSSAPQTLLPL